MRRRGGGGQVEEIDAEMNKTWAKERKVTDQLKTFKKRNAQHKQDIEIFNKCKLDFQTWEMHFQFHLVSLSLFVLILFQLSFDIAQNIFHPWIWDLRIFGLNKIPEVKKLFVGLDEGIVNCESHYGNSVTSMHCPLAGQSVEAKMTWTSDEWWGRAFQQYCR